MKIRILVADSHELMRSTLWNLLDNHSGIEVLAAANNSQSAVYLTWLLKPDVVVMDINMPDLSGVETFRRLAYAAPSTKLLALSLYPNQQFVEKLLTAGASGYLVKDFLYEELIYAVRKVADNQIYLSNTLEMPKYIPGHRMKEPPEIMKQLDTIAVS